MKQFVLIYIYINKIAIQQSELKPFGDESPCNSHHSSDVGVRQKNNESTYSRWLNPPLSA